MPTPTQEDLDKDFEVFYQEYPKDSPSPTHRHLVQYQSTSITHTRSYGSRGKDSCSIGTTHCLCQGSHPVVPIVPRPPTPTPAHATTAEATKKKRKREKPLRAPKKEKSPNPCNNCPPKSLELQGLTEGEQRPKPTIQNLAFVLNSGDIVTSKAFFRDPQKGRSRLVSKCLEKALMLPVDMQELQGQRKHDAFLSLKRDLVKV